MTLPQRSAFPPRARPMTGRRLNSTAPPSQLPLTIGRKRHPQRPDRTLRAGALPHRGDPKVRFATAPGRPMRQRADRRAACLQSLAMHERWAIGCWRLVLGDRSSARSGGRRRSSPPWDQRRCPARTTASISVLARRRQAPDARLERMAGCDPVPAPAPT